MTVFDAVFLFICLSILAGIMRFTAMAFFAEHPMVRFFFRGSI